MNKSLPIIAALVAWTGALAAISGFEAMDADRNGTISTQEHTAAAQAMFQAMDANGDGRVTAAEMHAAQEKVTGAKATGRDLSAAEKIKVVDTDGDGILSAAEHASGLSSMFGKMDADGDGSLSKAEFDAGHAMLKKQ